MRLRFKKIEKIFSKKEEIGKFCRIHYISGKICISANG